MSYSAYIFDFDYTLGDSTEGMVGSINYALKQMGLPVYSKEEIRKTVGMTMPNAFKHLTGINDEIQGAQFYDLFKKKADEVMTDGTVLLGDTIEVLTRINQSGCKTGIVTTKYHHRIDAILNKYGICSLVDTIVGLDNVKNAKPDPEALLLAVDKLRVNIKDVLYTGDSIIDAETAKSAHVDFFAVTTGTTTEYELKQYPNIAIAGNLKELINKHLIL